MQPYEIAVYNLGSQDAWEKIAGMPATAIRGATPQQIVNRANTTGAPLQMRAPGAMAPTPNAAPVGALGQWGQKAVGFAKQHADTLMPMGMMIGGTWLANKLLG